MSSQDFAPWMRGRFTGRFSMTADEAADLANLTALQAEALGVALEQIEELRAYASESWDWKYGERWNEEETQVRAAIQAAREFQEKYQ